LPLRQTIQNCRCPDFDASPAGKNTDILHVAFKRASASSALVMRKIFQIAGGQYKPPEGFAERRHWLALLSAVGKSPFFFNAAAISVPAINAGGIKRQA